MTRLRTLAALLGVVALAGCEKNGVQDISRPLSGAFVRFHNYGVSVPGVNFYANDQKVTAVSTGNCTPIPTDTILAAKCLAAGNESTTGVTVGNVADGGNYSMMPSGQYTLTGRIAATTDNGRVVSSVDGNLADGKFYSYFISGVYNTTAKTAEAFLVEDALPTTFDYTTAYLRLVNASPNSPPLSVSIRLQGSTTIIPVGSGLTYKSASPIATAAPGTYDFLLTANGSTLTLPGLSMIGGHVITIAFRGDWNTPSTVTLSGSYNR